MAPLKISSNFRCKALFGSKFARLPQELIALESPPPLEALNDLHVDFDLNVVSLNNK
jgi:hypothetical protein